MIGVKAALTAEIGNKGAREFPIETVEAFTIDTAMDSDSDSFSIDIGAPTPTLGFLVDRDNEVTASIFTSGIMASSVEHLHTGIADVVDYSSDDHIISIQGRDLSSPAVDSQAPPGEFRLVRPHVFVAREARTLGITKMQLAEVTMIPKFYRDGSETYWESWYRMYRKRKMWLWLEADGTLIGDKLNYEAKSRYQFGKAPSGGNSREWIPIETVTITKGTQGRIGECWVFGERGDFGFVGKAKDLSISSWKKKPLKIITSTDAKNRSDAYEEALEEIFEGKVGALEIVISIPLSEIGMFVKQNNMGKVNIPDMGLEGEFFVVGSQIMGGPDGYRQNVRLREKNFAISRRVPDDPKLNQDPTSGIPGDVADRLSGIRWGSAFAAAANEFHDGWALDLFLGVILSICDKETGFRNVRYSGSIEWYPKPPVGGPGPAGDTQVETWHQLFANSRTNKLNPLYPNSEAAVGPMQLVTPDFKVWADEYGGKSGEYDGGRWNPTANIRAGARAFAGKLAGLDPKNDNNIWIGVENYYGSKSRADNIAYRNDVHTRWKNQFQAVAEAAVVPLPGGKGPGSVTADGFTVIIPESAPTSIQDMIRSALKQRGKPYEWGAEGPDTFDCSGLAIFAYRAGGVNLLRMAGRTTYTMIASPNLTRVTKDALLNGDLVFFQDGGDVHHMGIYLNDGYMIHAPSTGDVVKLSSINASYYRARYAGARRVVPWSGRGR